MQESTNLGCAVEFRAFLLHAAHANHVRQEFMRQLRIGHDGTSSAWWSVVLLDGGGITFGQPEFASLQQSPHDLAAAGVRQRIDELEFLGRHGGPEPLARVAYQFQAQVFVADHAILSVTKALIISPTVGSGLPMTAASATAG